MFLKYVFKNSMILSIAIVLFVSNNCFSNSKDIFSVMVTSTTGKTMIIKQFESGCGKKFSSIWGQSHVELNFNDIKHVRFLQPGKNSQAEVVFKDGTRDTFDKVSLCKGFIKGQSKYGDWHLEWDKISEIEFDIKENVSSKATPLSDSYDRIVLKNGDAISANIMNKGFTLKTSYGTMEFNTSDIRNIEFEGGGLNVDVVVLKIGDRLSGIIESEIVSVKLISGNDINLNAEKVKSITFKKK